MGDKEEKNLPAVREKSLLARLGSSLAIPVKKLWEITKASVVAAGIRSVVTGVIEALGWDRVVVAAFLAAAALVGTWVSNLSWYWVIGSALFTFVAGIWLAVIFVRRGESGETKSESPEKVLAKEDKMVRLKDAIIRVAECSSWIKDFDYGNGITLGAQELRQSAAKGKIAIHGRKEINRHVPGDKFDDIYTEIKPEYWHDCEFELTVVVDDTPHIQTAETRPRDDSSARAASFPSYAALRVYKSDLDQNWPPEHRQIKRDIWLLDAMNYLVYGSWDETSSADEMADAIKFINAEQLVREKAYDGELKIWGQERSVDTSEEIPTEYWKHFLIDVTSASDRRPDLLKTKWIRHRPPSDMRSLRFLRTSRVQIERLWPKVTA